MRVGVLGGGLQGCCIALALAERGVEVTVIDRNERLLTRAGVANEGKVHLGYMYANDLSLNTARMMIRGALDFAPFFSRHLGIAIDAFATSAPANYLVHRESQQDPESVEGYLSAVQDLIRDGLGAQRRSYFGIDLDRGIRRWTAGECAAAFDSGSIVAAFATPEVAINPVVLADSVRDALSASPLIEVRCNERVVSVEDTPAGLEVTTHGLGGSTRQRFDQVVNALWDGRLVIDKDFGIDPPRRWLHRLKYGVSLRLTSPTLPPSVTIVSGPFGEVVSYGEGLTYLTWYPECLQDISKEIEPPDWPTYPSEPLRSRLIEGTLKALAEIVITLRGLDMTDLAEAHVKGGAIVAWGDSDIYDPQSELHQRYRLGVASSGRFHSVDPGKLTMAPHFAQACADRITSRF
jgi:hypothetical protein